MVIVNGEHLFEFYIRIIVKGIDKVKQQTTKSTYYRKVKKLKDAHIDISQKLEINFDDYIINFNPFDYLEVK